MYRCTVRWSRGMQGIGWQIWGFGNGIHADLICLRFARNFLIWVCWIGEGLTFTGSFRVRTPFFSFFFRQEAEDSRFGCLSASRGGQRQFLVYVKSSIIKRRTKQFTSNLNPQPPDAILNITNLHLVTTSINDAESCAKPVEIAFMATNHSKLTSLPD